MISLFRPVVDGALTPGANSDLSGKEFTASLLIILVLILASTSLLVFLIMRRGNRFAPRFFKRFERNRLPNFAGNHQAMRDSQMSMITRALPCKVCYVDARGILVFTNHESYGVFEGLPMRVKLGDEIYNRFEPLFKKSLEGKTINVELTGMFGPNQISHMNFIPHYDGEGDVLGVICVGTDVTQYRNVERELSAAKEVADSANAAKSSFLAHMSHEIRSPLGAVLGFSELLAKPSITDLERDRYLDAIKRNGLLLKRLIDDILDISKVESGKITLDLRTVPLKEILIDIRTHLEVQAAEKSLPLILNPIGDLPGLIETDPTRLRQILINVVGNAIKFTDHGQVEVRIETIAETGLLAFHVKDSGCGISAQQAPNLFQSFVQADKKIHGEYGGTGLGLVLSRRFARLLGGDVVLTQSAEGEGSIFTVTIDSSMSEPVRDVLSLPPLLDVFTPDPFVLQGIHVLVVEDAPDNQLLVGTYLESAGATYALAGNGVEALEQVGNQVFDIVIMDIQMPMMDGYETADELRSRGFHKPLVALTGFAMHDERMRCLAHGFEHHIVKPINPQTLIATIKQLVFTNQNPKVFFEGKLSKAAIVTTPNPQTLTITEAMTAPRL